MPLPDLFSLRSRRAIRLTASTEINRARSRGPRRSRRAHVRRGLTLIEMLVSVTITLLVVFAIVQVFDMLGQTMTKGRATIEMAGNLRAVANRLQDDLDNLTCPVRPWIDPAAGEGYFEYVEGFVFAAPGTDISPRSINGATPTGGHFGDISDVLMMTVKASGEPFRGRYDADLLSANGYEIVESEYAEIIWWTTFDPNSNTATLRRRVLLIRPDLTVPNTNLVTFYQNNDISVRVDIAAGNRTLVSNSLSDLTSPRNRFGHFASQFFTTLPPDEWVFPLDPSYLNTLVLSMDRLGDDVVLGDVLAFDVRAYDPGAPVRMINNLAVSPSDPGYNQAGWTNVGSGAFVDLGFAPTGITSDFARLPQSPIPAIGSTATLISYDTWSLGFEHDGINQDASWNSALVDEGFDGIDNPDYENPGLPIGGVDDYRERETNPPYNVPLTGIEVRIRMMEYSTRQIRQVSVVGDFTQ